MHFSNHITYLLLLVAFLTMVLATSPSHGARVACFTDDQGETRCTNHPTLDPKWKPPAQNALNTRPPEEIATGGKNAIQSPVTLQAWLLKVKHATIPLNREQKRQYLRWIDWPKEEITWVVEVNEVVNAELFNPDGTRFLVRSRTLEPEKIRGIPVEFDVDVRRQRLPAKGERLMVSGSLSIDEDIVRFMDRHGYIYRPLTLSNTKRVQ